jgi:hypothetical protein
LVLSGGFSVGVCAIFNSLLPSLFSNWYFAKVAPSDDC